MDCDITFLPFRRMLTQRKLAKLQSVYQQAQAPLLQVHVYTCIHLNIFIALQCVVYGYISLLTSLTLELKAETRNSIPAPSGSDKVRVRVYVLHRGIYALFMFSMHVYMQVVVSPIQESEGTCIY